MPLSCAMLPLGLRPSGNIAQLRFGHNLSMLTSAPVNICIVCNDRMLHRATSQFFTRKLSHRLSFIAKLSVLEKLQFAERLCGKIDWCNVSHGQFSVFAWLCLH